VGGFFLFGPRPMYLPPGPLRVYHFGSTLELGLIAGEQQVFFLSLGRPLPDDRQVPFSRRAGPEDHQERGVAGRREDPHVSLPSVPLPHPFGANF